MKKLFIFLLILWVGIIFYLSGTNGAASHKESIQLVNIFSDIKIIKTAIHELKITNTDQFIRKNAHAFEYIVLAILSSAIFFSTNKKGLSAIIYILFTCLLLAILDEYHQSFVPGRASLVSDILIDFIGSIIGIVIFYIGYYKIKKLTRFNT